MYLFSQWISALHFSVQQLQDTKLSSNKKNVVPQMFGLMFVCLNCHSQAAAHNSRSPLPASFWGDVWCVWGFSNGSDVWRKSARCLLVDVRKVLSKTGVNPKQPGREKPKIRKKDKCTKHHVATSACGLLGESPNNIIFATGFTGRTAWKQHIHFHPAAAAVLRTRHKQNPRQTQYSYNSSTHIKKQLKRKTWKLGVWFLHIWDPISDRRAP